VKDSLSARKLLDIERVEREVKCGMIPLHSGSHSSAFPTMNGYDVEDFKIPKIPMERGEIAAASRIDRFLEEDRKGGFF